MENPILFFKSCPEINRQHVCKATNTRYDAFMRAIRLPQCKTKMRPEEVERLNEWIAAHVQKVQELTQKYLETAE